MNKEGFYSNFIHSFPKLFPVLSGFCGIFAPFFGKKAVQKGLTFCRQNAALVVGTVFVRQVKQAGDAADGTLPRVAGAIEHTADATLQNGAGAHGAGFQGHIQVAPVQTPAAQCAAGVFNGGRE